MSDYLSEEEQLARMKSWWSENGTMVLLALGLTVAAVVGWRWYQSDQARKTEEGSSIYAEFLEADEDVRPALAQELGEVAGGTAYPVLAQLALAATALTEEGAEAARPLLESALDQADDAELKDLIQLRLAKVEQQAGDTEAALAALGSVRGSGYRSLVAELKGDIHMARDERALAHESYTAALAAVSEGERRPVLALKASSTAAALTGGDAPQETGASNEPEQTPDSEVEPSASQTTDAGTDNG